MYFIASRCSLKFNVADSPVVPTETMPLVPSLICQSIKSHENFKSKQNFPFELLSDPDEKVCKAFDVMKLKSMYGREYIGVDRSTFLINTKGMIVKEWRSVKVKGHVAEVLDTLENYLKA